MHALLVSQGWTVHEAATLAEARSAVDAMRFGLLIVDLGLPDGDGVELIAHARRRGSMPIIVLSARLEEDQKVRALDAGADDYVEKPFRAQEFLARVRAQARGRLLPTDRGGTIRLGEIEFDGEARVVRKRGKDVHLTPTEYTLFAYLVRNAGRVLTQRQLLAEVWGRERVENAHHLRVFMAALRHKLEANPAQPRLIVTETGVGYRLLADDLGREPVDGERPEGG